MIAHPVHVAILDDDPSIRTALGRLLKSAGMVVDAYDTSDKLFGSVALKCPDCLLLDLQMPGMSGLDVLKHLGQRHIRIPTVIITALEDAGARSACLIAGAAAYLSKPLDAEHLVRTIDGIYESSQPDKPLSLN
jgi:FixJ family two-component response regulator